MKSSILIVLALGFAGFGALEVAALNPGEAGFGTDASTPADPKTDAPEPIDFGAITAEDNSPEGTSCLTPALVAAFEPRHKELQAREIKLDQREAELQELQKTLQGRLSDIQTTRDKIAAMTDRLDTVAGEDITHLVNMYSTMKPKKAAAIFDRMDPAFAAGFLREIDPARAGVIMAEMGEEQSYRVSLLIANRHAEWRNGR
jgi:flagellar motility protein MotE (MotC chaperone)